MSCRTRRRIVLASLTLLLMAAGAGGVLAARGPAPSYMLAGTLVGSDGHAGVAGASVTLFPDSVIAVSDRDGDFFLPWNGKEVWLTVVPVEKGPSGTDWCKRVAVRAHAEADGEVKDLGPIRVTPKAFVSYSRIPTQPSGSPYPKSLRAAGPKAGEPDTCRTQFSFGADLWGHVTRAEVCGGDTPPSALKKAMLDWVRGVQWNVAPESSCDPGEPFKALLWLDYAWADTSWVLTSALKDYQRPGSKLPLPRPAQ
jgi:hypothetical protein